MTNATEPSAFADGRVNGSRATYMQYGCRCAPCVAAARAHNRRKHERSRDLQGARIGLPTHNANSDVRERLRLLIAEYLAS